MVRTRFAFAFAFASASLAVAIGAVGAVGAVGATSGIALSFAACGGGVVSLAGDQPSDGDGGLPGFGTIDPEAVSAVERACAAGAAHANICCRFGLDGGLACGQWTATPLKACPTEYAKYEDPVLCCTSDSCEPGAANDAGDGGMLHVVDAGPTTSCPLDCSGVSGWPTPDGRGCCQASGAGTTCSEGAFPPVYEYPVAATFDTADASAGPLACPEGSTRTADGLGCCRVNGAGYSVCGELASADAGDPTTTLGVAGSCAAGGVCCGPNATPTLDRLGCCTVDSRDFALCIHYTDPAAFDGGALPGSVFYSGSVVPWPWGPSATTGDCPSSSP